jgi:GNAT superfamily N-acetyltransferase
MQRLTDPAVLEPILNRDWQWAGFAIGDLEPQWMRHCEWLLHGDSLVLLFDGLAPRLLCHYGEPSDLAPILAAIDVPRVWANIHSDCEETFHRFYQPERSVRMCRMYSEQAVPAEGQAVALSSGDRAEIEELLATGEWVLFLPDRLDGGFYYGVRVNGRLVAVAGTHLASTRYNIAALGSVFTHPDQRGQGLARVCCSHVLAAVGHAGIRRVVLNVEEAKASARRLYEGLGFRTACVYTDGEYVRRSIRS